MVKMNIIRKLTFAKVVPVILCMIFLANFAVADNPVVCPGETITLSATASDPWDCDYTGVCPERVGEDGSTITVTWSAKWKVSGQSAGSFPNGNEGSSVSWTAPSSAGDVIITATADNSASTKYPDPDASDQVTVTVVKVDKLQYYDDYTSSYIDMPNPLYVVKGQPVLLKAIKDPSDASWPSGKPIWGGTAGLSGTGEQKVLNVATVSSSSTDYKTVTVTCGNTVTANTIIYDFDGELTPVYFDGRSQSKYGIAEVVNLSYTIDPSDLTATQVGGLKWYKYSGVGTVSGGSDGMGTYDAGASAGSVNLFLRVESGPCRAYNKDYYKTVVKPSGGVVVKKPSSNIWHIENRLSVGLLTDFYITPDDVSFCNVDFKEGSCSPGEASGMLSGMGDHPAWDTWYDIIGNGENKVDLPANMDAAEMYSDEVTEVEQYSLGEAYWDIPWKYKVGVVEGTITTMRQHFKTYSGGDHEVKKGTEGWHRVNHTDSPQSYY